MDEHTSKQAPVETWEPGDDEAEIRYSLTALGEAAVGEAASRKRFRGFGPCMAVA
jgi:hypothetical protein